MRINKTLVGRAIPPTLVACLCVAGNAFGGFVNGGFEDGTLNGWTVQQGFDEGASGLLSGHSGNVGNTDPLQNVVWGQQNYYSTAPAPVVVNKSGYSDPYVANIQSMFIGNDMVKINDIGGNCHVTQISQTGLINAGDMTGGATFADLYLNWVGVMENPGHPHLDDPWFIIDVMKNGTLFYEERHFSEEAGWTQVGATGVFENSGQVHLTGLLAGDSVTVEMTVSDCGQGGHGAYAYLDGLGTSYIPTPTGVPDAGSTGLLLGAACAGISLLRRKLS